MIEGPIDPEAMLVTVAVAARTLALAEVTVRKKVREGKIAIVRYGRAVRIPWREVQRLAAEGLE